MNTELDTPMTDDNEMTPRLDIENMVVSSDFARQLERETNELRELLKQSLEYLEDHTDEGSLHSGWKSKELLALISKIEEKTK
jgi:hypothetical protein